MDEDRDLERRLEAMYGSARPRAGYEDELWKRIQARRPWRRRLAAWLQPGLRLAPALAVVLVVALGVGFFATRVHPQVGTTTSFSSGGGGTAGGARAGPGFGVLPSVPGATKSRIAAPTAAGAAAQPAPSQAEIGSYVFVGRLPNLPGALPVYRYDEPTPSARTAAADQLRKQTGLRADVQSSHAATGQEPQFVLHGIEAQVSLPSLVATAEAFVTGHMLTPSYSFQVTVPPNSQSVVYARQFQVGGTKVPVARTAGGATGLAVQVEGNLVVGASGPLELPLDTADYPVRTASEVLSGAGVRPAAEGASMPILDHAQLVYVVVVSGGHGYYEPEMLFTGAAGTVLAPLVSTNWLSG